MRLSSWKSWGSQWVERSICHLQRKHQEMWSWSRQCAQAKMEPATAPRSPSH